MSFHYYVTLAAGIDNGALSNVRRKVDRLIDVPWDGIAEMFTSELERKGKGTLACFIEYN